MWVRQQNRCFAQHTENLFGSKIKWFSYLMRLNYSFAIVGLAIRRTSPIYDYFNRTLPTLTPTYRCHSSNNKDIFPNSGAPCDVNRLWTVSNLILFENLKDKFPQHRMRDFPALQNLSVRWDRWCIHVEWNTSVFTETTTAGHDMRRK